MLNFRTDYHSHILPKMDDGAASSAEALKMLLESAKQGITRIYATPHFYPDRDNPDSFFSRRKSCFDRLMEVSQGYEVPEVKLGAELGYFFGIGHFDDIKNFCYEDSIAVLVEMPFGPWSERMIDDIRSITASGIFPILAHIERYLDWVDIETLSSLKEDGIRLQCNASFFIDRKTRAFAKRFAEDGFVDYLGSDMHNTGLRSQNIAKAYVILNEQTGN